MNKQIPKALNLIIAAVFLLSFSGDGKASRRLETAACAAAKNLAFGDLSDDIIGTWHLDGDATNRFTFGRDGRFSNAAGGAVERGTYRISDSTGVLETKVERGTTRFNIKIDGDTLFISVGGDRLIYKRVRRNSAGNSPGGAGRRRAAADDVDLSTPTKAFAAFYQAVENRDANLFRRAASSRTLESMSAGAARQNKKFDDDFIRAYLDKLASKISETPETRNEKISGERATLEEKLASGWRAVVCVKESGAWKYDSFY